MSYKLGVAIELYNLKPKDQTLWFISTETGLKRKKKIPQRKQSIERAAGLVNKRKKRAKRERIGVYLLPLLNQRE